MKKGELAIAIKTVKAGKERLLKRGQVYPILGVVKGCCEKMIDVGVKVEGKRAKVVCQQCGHTSSRNRILFPNRHFKPYDKLHQQVDLIEQQVKRYLNEERKKARSGKKSS